MTPDTDSRLQAVIFIAGIYMTKNPCNNSGDTNNKNNISNRNCNNTNTDNSHHGTQDNSNSSNTMAGIASRHSCGHKEGCCLAMLPGAAPTALPSRSGAECASVISLLVIAVIIVRKITVAIIGILYFLLFRVSSCLRSWHSRAQVEAHTA